MFSYPNERLFRELILLAIALQILVELAPSFGWISGGVPAQNALQWSTYGSIFPYKVVYVWGEAYSALFLLGLLFFYFLQGWSRFFLLGLFFLSMAMTPFCGLSVSDSFSSFLYSVLYFAVWIPFLLSFFPPCSGYFKH